MLKLTDWHHGMLPRPLRRSNLSSLMIRIVPPEDTVDAKLYSLTSRQMEVFLLLGQGQSTDDISKSMNLSDKTVQSHCSAIKSKLSIDTSSMVRYHATRVWLTYYKKTPASTPNVITNEEWSLLKQLASSVGGRLLDKDDGPSPISRVL